MSPSSVFDWLRREPVIEEKRASLLDLSEHLQRGLDHRHILKAVVESTPVHLLLFRRGDDGVIRYVDGNDLPFVHTKWAMDSAVGRGCKEWLEEIGAGDIYPLYPRVLDNAETFCFRYLHGGARSVTTLSRANGKTGVVASVVLDEIEALYGACPLPFEVD